MSSVFGYFIKLIHLLLILFVILTPFLSDSPIILLLHFTTCLTLLAHWYANNDACFLTLLEKKIFNRTDDTSFIKSIVNTVYIIDDQKIKSFVSYTTILLSAISFSKLFPIFKEIYKTGDYTLLLKI